MYPSIGSRAAEQGSSSPRPEREVKGTPCPNAQNTKDSAIYGEGCPSSSRWPKDKTILPSWEESKQKISISREKKKNPSPLLTEASLPGHGGTIRRPYGNGEEGKGGGGNFTSRGEPTNALPGRFSP